MDDCDTAALTFQCGQEKAPDLVANAILSVEHSSPEEVILRAKSKNPHQIRLMIVQEKSPLRSTVGICIADYTCVINVCTKN
jgi:hypothetical protein